MRTHRGFTLVEMIVAIFVVSIGLVATVHVGAEMRRDSRVSETANQILRLDRAIRDAYLNEPNYASVNVNQLVLRNALPPDMRYTLAANTAKTALGTRVQVDPSSYVGPGQAGVTNASYAITLRELRRSECTALARSLAPAFLHTDANGTMIAAGRGQQPTMDVITAACSLDINNVLSVRSN